MPWSAVTRMRVRSRRPLWRSIETTSPRRVSCSAMRWCPPRDDVPFPAAAHHIHPRAVGDLREEHGYVVLAAAGPLIHIALHAAQGGEIVVELAVPERLLRLRGHLLRIANHGPLDTHHPVHALFAAGSNRTWHVHSRPVIGRSHAAEDAGYDAAGVLEQARAAGGIHARIDRNHRFVGDGICGVV